ncbi:MAG: CPBP family intramembrane glutamic endopeptidase [Acidimicrobiales bacterium]
MDTTTADAGRTPRITWAVVLGFFLVHTAVWIGLVRLVPGDDFVDYDDLGVLGLPWVRQFVVALVVVLVVQLAFIGRLGWWREVWRDARPGRWWMWLPVALVVLAAVGTIAREGVSDAPTHYWVGMTLTMVLVGATEELTFRGILLVGARELVDERRAWLVSSALFGLFHLPNAILGQSLALSLRQVVATAVIGSAFYCLRRAGGWLLPCIVLHAAYDWCVIQGNALG